MVMRFYLILFLSIHFFFNLFNLLPNWHFKVYKSMLVNVPVCLQLYDLWISVYLPSTLGNPTTHLGWWGIPQRAEKQGLTKKRPSKWKDSVSAFRKGRSQRAFFCMSWGNWLQMSQYVVLPTVVMSVLQLAKMHLTVAPTISSWFYRFSTHWLYMGWIAQIW